MSKPVVLVFGGSGLTGTSIVNALLEQGDFIVKIAARPSSSAKPSVLEFQKRGVEIVAVDMVTAPHEELVRALKGVDTIICALVYTLIPSQRRLVDAAKDASVKRFIPSDFGSAGKRGYRELFDQKLDVQDYIRGSGVPYTFIDVGFWYQLHLVEVKEEKAYAPFLWEASRIIYNGGTVKTAYTDLGDIGRYVAMAAADPRTLNHYVFAYGEEVTQQDLVKLAEEINNVKVETIPKTTDDLLKLIDAARASQDGTLAYWEYHYSMWVLGENLVEKAVLPEYGSALDARKLYPEFKARPLRDYAIEYYSQ